MSKAIHELLNLKPINKRNKKEVATATLSKEEVPSTSKETNTASSIDKSLKDAFIENESESHVSNCACANCSQVMSRFAECAICSEPLQGNSPCMCNNCGAVWCGFCDVRMTTCAWCRVSIGKSARCRGLQRLLDDLLLPCRNHRYGCKELLTTPLRANHEENCAHELMPCPIKSKCSSCNFERISDHLKSQHDIVSVYARKVQIVVERVKNKLQTTSSGKNQYRVVLLHRKSAFSVKIYIYNYKVKVVINQRKLGLKTYGGQVNTATGYVGVVDFEGEHVGSVKSLRFPIYNEAYVECAEMNMKGYADKLEMNDAITVNVQIENV